MNEIERIARELCKVDGHNPDDQVVPRGLELPWNPHGLVVPQNAVFEPLWTRYTHFVPVILDAKNGFVEEPEPEIKDIKPDWRHRYGLMGAPPFGRGRVGLPPK